METTTAAPEFVDVAELAQEVERLRAEIADLRAAAHLRDALEDRDEVATFRTESGGFVALLPRTLNGTGRDGIDKLTDEWDALEVRAQSHPSL